MKRRRDRVRHGTVAAGLILVLVLCQTVVVCSVISGVRDDDIAVQRIDTVRAYYAADAGLQMSLREIFSGVDEDGDGAMGSISDDNNSSNDPMLITARVKVARTLVGSDTAIVAAGRSGVSRRSLDARVTGVIGGSTQTVMVVWSRGSSPQPRYSSWDGTGWTASQPLASIGSVAKWIRLQICPTRNETCFVAEGKNDRVNVMFYNSPSWGNPLEVSTDTAGTNDRPEDCAYEQLSSRALAVYWKDTAKKFGYRTYNGTSFSSESLLSSPFSTEADYLTLYPRPGSNEIMMLTADGVSGGPLKAALWNGSSFGAWSTVCSALETNNDECYSMAFECNSQKGVAVYSQSGQMSPRYRTWNGSWSSEGTLPSFGGVPQWVKLAPDPAGNTIICAALDDQQDLNVSVWNGSSWGSVLELETNAGAADRRKFDVVFERGTGKALIVYAEGSLSTPRYRTWNGSSWSAELTGPSVGASPEFVHLARGFANGELFMATSTSNRKLYAARWDGSAFSTATLLENGLGAQVFQQNFSLPEPTVAPHPRVVSANEVSP